MTKEPELFFPVSECWQENSPGLFFQKKRHFFLKKFPLGNYRIVRKWHQKKWIFRIHKMADIGEKKVKA